MNNLTDFWNSGRKQSPFVGPFLLSLVIFFLVTEANLPISLLGAFLGAGINYLIGDDY